MNAVAGIDGRIALVTGSASGIGAATARALAGAGARVVVSDTDAVGGEAVVDDITRRGGDATFVACDVSREADVHRLVQATVDRYGRLDIAHNNAGIPGKAAPFVDQSTDTWNAVVGVNLTGVFLCMRAELAVMTRQGSGVIVNTASNAGVRGLPNLAPYVATKFGVIGMTRSAAVEHGGLGIRVNAVCPGATRTPMLDAALERDSDMERRISASVPLGRVGEVDEIAQVVLWLASDASSYVTGATVMADGGNTAG